MVVGVTDPATRPQHEVLRLAHLKMFVAGEADLGSTFPARTVIILSLCMTLNTYTLVNLFPYVGIMVKDLLELETTNELGELLLLALFLYPKVTQQRIVFVL